MAKLNFPLIRQLTVTTAAQKILTLNPRRKAVLIFNNGSVAAELLSAENQVYGDGIPIKPGIAYDSDHFNPQGEYWIICNTGTVDVRIEEDVQQDA